MAGLIAVSLVAAPVFAGSFFEGVDDGHVGALELGDLGPEVSLCYYASPDSKLLACLTREETVATPVWDALVVDLERGHSELFHLVADNPGGESGEYDEAAARAFSQAIAAVSDWEAREALLRFDSFEDEPPSEPVALEDGLALALVRPLDDAARSLQLLRGEALVRSQALATGQGGIHLAVYTLPGARFAFVLVTDYNPDFVYRTTETLFLDLSDGSSASTARSEPLPAVEATDRDTVASHRATSAVRAQEYLIDCPTAAVCPTHYTRVYPFLERLCDGSFGADDLAAVERHVAAGELDALDLTRLFNTVGAMTGYAFKDEGLAAFYYGEAVGGVAKASWLPASCREAIASPREMDAIPKEIRRAREAIKDLYVSIK